MAAWAGLGLAQEHQISTIDAAAQEKANRLLQTIIEDYWNGGYTNRAGGTNTVGSSTNVEMAFRAASKLMPDRLDLRFGIASALMLQAIQTNGPQLELKVRQALREYEGIEALDPNGFEAPIWFAAYAHAIGVTNEFEAALGRLMAVHPGRTREYLETISRVDQILQLVPNVKPRRTLPKDNHRAIVVLGAGLETNGTLKVKLASGLNQGLKLARMYRRAPIIVTGGNQKGGVTEAYVMSQWLIRRGVSRKRLFIEDQAKDTVENALFSSVILQQLGVTHVTVVTSSNHIRRGLADLEEACRQRGLKLEYDHLGAKAKGDKELDKEQERLGVYRDVLRISGLWAFPGLRR